MAIEVFLERAKEIGLQAAAEETRRERHAYLAPSDEPLSWDTSGVVRVDVVIHALRIAHARVALYAVPRMVRRRLDTFKRKLVEAGAKQVVKVGFGIAAKRLLAVLTAGFEVFQVIEMEKEIEAAVRRASIRTMRELLKAKLNKTKTDKGRKVRRVASRHK